MNRLSAIQLCAVSTTISVRMVLPTSFQALSWKAIAESISVLVSETNGAD